MKTDQPPVIRLADYQPPAFSVEAVDLVFDLSPQETKVRSSLKMRRKDGASGPLVLDGEGLTLLSIAIDGEALNDNAYSQSETGLTLADPPDAFELTTEVAIDPVHNTRLEGLYLSNGIYCTQCEAEGFRRIAFFPDRPDVMTTYRVAIRADKASAPVLLSNGNLTAEGDLENGRHEAVWEDPFPKPSYLFALVGGQLDVLEDTFTTKSGRRVALKIWVEPGNASRCAYAMDALKRSMKWDEDRFGLEYDLDIFNIVAVSDFNMGAMENKSLNVFNAKYILADPNTATDMDYANIETIVAHEYFHNWTGNRVTCRDWFQLSLKEGLTVFRDQEFTSDMRSRAVKRIADVSILRSNQFPEDAGPLAHPVRPDSYIEINNFYTATVYEKGAEVIRMQHALLGEESFQKGMRLYFERHDGQAVTCDDFVAAMADANGVDLSGIKPWYAQAGTPHVTAAWRHDPEAATLTLALCQKTDPTSGQPEKQPLPIPLRMGLLTAKGISLPLRVNGEALGDETVLTLEQAQMDVVFEDITLPVVPSLNRGFSAPVVLKTDHTPEDQVLIMSHDPDPFARWEAAQQFGTALLLEMVASLQAGDAPEPDRRYIDAVARIFYNEDLDHAFRAKAIALPSEDYLAEQMRPVAVVEIHQVRLILAAAFGRKHWMGLLGSHEELASDAPYSPDYESAGKRALRNMVLTCLVSTKRNAATHLAKECYDTADNMTDRMAALSSLCLTDGPAWDDALGDFHDRFKADEQVMDKWLAVQSMAPRENALDRVKRLMEHPVFSMKKPNKVRALIGGFTHGNAIRFHAADGSGYRFVADVLLDLDKLNPQVAARTLGVFGQWRRMDDCRKALMQETLERIAGSEGLSRDCTEIATKALAE